MAATSSEKTLANLNKNLIKEALKDALVETLQEHRELLYDVFAEVLEDFALAEATREGQKTKFSLEASGVAPALKSRRTSPGRHD